MYVCTLPTMGRYTYNYANFLLEACCSVQLTLEIGKFALFQTWRSYKVYSVHNTQIPIIIT